MLLRNLPLVAALLIAPGLSAQAPVRILCSNGVKALVEDVQGECERAVGRKLAIEYSSSSSLRPRIESGEAFDIAILTPELVDSLTKAGKLMPGTRADLAKSGVGVGAASGGPKLDVHTPEAFKNTLLQAKSISYTQGGASQAHIESTLAKLGIRDQVQNKIILESAGRPAIRVAEGGAELVLTPISEILPVRGVRLVGPFPSELQSYISFAAAVGKGSTDPAAAKAVIQYWTSPAVTAKLKAKGLERP